LRKHLRPKHLPDRSRRQPFRIRFKLDERFGRRSGEPNERIAQRAQGWCSHSVFLGYTEPATI
jgi:hypothetical protein